MAEDDSQKTPLRQASGEEAGRFVIMIGGGGYSKSEEFLLNYLREVFRSRRRTSLLDLRRESTPASQSVARTAWTLWHGCPERIWSMIADWSEDRDLAESNFLGAGQTILTLGLSEGHLEIGPTLGRLKDWLGSSSRLRNLSARMLPSLLSRMKSEEIERIVSEWADDKRASSLGNAIADLFEAQSKTCLKMMRKWIRAGTPEMDTLLVACFKTLQVPQLAKAREYRDLEMALRGLRLDLGRKRAPELRRAIDQFLKHLHRKMSAKAGEGARLPEAIPRSRAAPRKAGKRPLPPRRGLG